MCSSDLEGIGEHNDYIRWPSEWHIIQQNIQTLKSRVPNAQLTINHTLQHTSIYTIQNLIEYAEKNNIMLGMHEVYFGSYPSEGVLTKNSVPLEKMENFRIWLDSYNGKYKSKLNSWLSTYEFDSQLYTKFVSYVTMLDSIRGTNFGKTF